MFHTARPSTPAKTMQARHIRRAMFRVRRSECENELKWSSTVNAAEDYEPFVTPEEAANFLRISPVTVKKMAREGDLPAHPIGNGLRKRWRFRISELVSHMRCRVQSESSSVRALRRKAS
jgi:excisionase family DNA binding protein